MLKFLVLTSRGIENLLKQELDDIGVEASKETIGGVWVDTDLRTAYEICLHSRLATRVLLWQAEGTVDSADDLYSIAQKVDWPMQFSNKHSFVVDFSGTNNTVRNSQFGGLKLKDAIVDQFYEESGHRPDIDKLDPDFRVVARLRKHLLQIFIDFSGPSLSQRGYRQEQGKAPLKEHLAAALLKRAKWQPEQPLMDVFCGAGTIVIEAAMMALGIAPGAQRANFGFKHWLGHRKALWQEMRQAAQTQAKDAKAERASGLRIFASDLDPSVVKKARMNATRAGLSECIQFEVKNALEATPATEDSGVLVSNPPYGERMGDMAELATMFNQFGDCLKTNFVGWRAGVLCEDAQMLSALKLSKDKQYKLKNGPIDCIFNLYQVTEKQAQQSQVELQSDFINRLKKNVKNLSNWVKKEDIQAYRVYDADLPEYNVAIDIYADYAVVQEYAPPKDIDAGKAKKRLMHILAATPVVLGIPAEQVIYKVRKQQKGRNQYQSLGKKATELVVSEYGAKFKVNLTDYLDTGLFLDHRTTRQLVAKRAKDKAVLNLFAYTGSVSVHAACHGAKAVTTVDMSNTYLAWAKENFELNKLQGKQYQFIAADCLKWVARSEEKFDLIFVDPPTFSNSKKMDESFDVQRDHLAMLTAIKSLLNPGGEIVFTNNKRNFEIDKDGLANAGLNVTSLSRQTLPLDYKRNPKIHNSWSIRAND